MSTRNRAFERATVERVAQEYRDKGYQVVVQPDATERPDFIREYQPDIIARSPRETVVIEVKNWVSAAERDQLQAIAKRVEGRPGWRFVVVSPGDVGGAPGPELTDLQEPQIVQLLNQATNLRADGQIQAALLVAWSALEAAMRRAAEANAIELRRSDPWAVMRELVSNGVLDRQRYRDISDVLRVRSAIAHGFAAPETVDLAPALDLIETSARELLAEAGRPIE
jgi:hypothetical protein